MPKQIKITINPKMRFGASAKPGEITFGTHTHLTQYKKPSKIELRLLKTQKAFKETSELMKKIAPNRSIKTMLAELKRVQAINQFSSAQRMALISNYSELKGLAKKTTTLELKKRFEQKAQTTYDRVKKLEELMQNSRIIEENLKEHLTLALNQKEKPKKKKANHTIKKTLSEREKEYANQLLDAKNLYSKRITRIQNEINNSKLSTPQLIYKRMMLKEAQLGLEQTNERLINLTNPSKKQVLKKN
ncbi:MAG: hypothetical protein PHY04_00080 [Candidatus ainarchaeum sp.]|jgi:hypothetical protein|nr:hypothetical protein [Candidatus ainarchaeum sp.]